MQNDIVRASPQEYDAGREYERESCMSEKELVESEGIHYIRIPVTDHTWPEPEYVDEFLELIKNVGMDNLWLHVHCHA